MITTRLMLIAKRKRYKLKYTSCNWREAARGNVDHGTLIAEAMGVRSGGPAVRMKARESNKKNGRVEAHVMRMRTMAKKTGLHKFLRFSWIHDVFFSKLSA
jgi:hypothetical protein